MPTAKERMLAGEPYLSGDEELVADRVRCRLALRQVNTADPGDAAAREEMLRGLLGSLGAGTEILSPFQCDYGYQIEVGDSTFINFNAVILDSAPVRIGDHVQIGPGVQLITPTHPLDPEERRTSLEFCAPITLADDVWLAAGVTVGPGVTIGAGTVIGAGSLVTRDLPARHLCYGSPCRPVRPV